MDGESLLVGIARPDGGRSDVSYRLQGATDLTDWQQLTDLPASTQSLGGGLEMLWFQAPGNAPERFFRLEVGR
jgi:hypothetical protein